MARFLILDVYGHPGNKDPLEIELPAKSYKDAVTSRYGKAPYTISKSGHPNVRYVNCEDKTHDVAVIVIKLGE